MQILPTLLLLPSLALGNILFSPQPPPSAPEPVVADQVRMTAAPALPMITLQSLAIRRDLIQSMAESANNQVLSWANSVGQSWISIDKSMGESALSFVTSVGHSAVSIATSVAGDALSSASQVIKSAENVALTATGAAAAVANSAAAAAAQTATDTQNAAREVFGPPSFMLFGGLAMYASLFLIFLL